MSYLQLLVGYNDAFLTREGFTGGLIVKNSWADGPYQGSHSLAYWMQEVSDWEERSVCPNSYKYVVSFATTCSGLGCKD